MAGTDETKQHRIHLLHLHCHVSGMGLLLAPDIQIRAIPDQESPKINQLTLGAEQDEPTALHKDSLAPGLERQDPEGWPLRPCLQISFPLDVDPDLVFPVGPVPPHWLRGREWSTHRIVTELLFHKKTAEDSVVFKILS